jgi:hypothetical protein
MFQLVRRRFLISRTEVDYSTMMAGVWLFSSSRAVDRFPVRKQFVYPGLWALIALHVGICLRHVSSTCINSFSEEGHKLLNMDRRCRLHVKPPKLGLW